MNCVQNEGKNHPQAQISKYKRPMNRVTVLSKMPGVLIATSKDPDGVQAGSRLQAAFQKAGVHVDVAYDPAPDVLYEKDRPIIVVGKLSNNRCVKTMYYKLMVVTDDSYPGKNGYHIRTLVNPFRTGHNIIHIGYSDRDGLYEALDCFRPLAGKQIEYLNRVSIPDFPYDLESMEDIRTSKVPERLELVPSAHTSSWGRIGFVCYLTGDMRGFDTYLDGWRKMVEISKQTPFLIKATHLYMTQYLEVWRLLDIAGFIPDDLRGEIAQGIFDWAQSEEGVLYARNHRGYELPSHNHTMFCALSLTYAADYFGRFFPSLPQPKQWQQTARLVFDTFYRHGWKPYCDDSAYSNQVSLPLVCLFFIFQDDPTFYLQAGRQAMEWIKAILGQNMFIPSFGDGTVKNPFPVVLAQIFSHYYKDGQIKAMLERYMDGDKGRINMGLRTFDSQVAHKEIKIQSKITAVPLDRYTYDIWQVDETAAKRFATTPPYAPIKRCFDKVSIRTGWDEIQDDFLLIDGLGSNGVHAYSDTAGILDYTCKGIVWLVEENCYRWPEPENCSIVTVTKDGFTSPVPAYAELQEAKSLDNTRFTLKIRLRSYHGVTWVREVCLVKGQGLLFHDTLTAEQPGEYLFETHFRTPGFVSYKDQSVRSVRQNAKGESFEMRLTGYGSHEVSFSKDTIPYGQTLFSYGGMRESDRNKCEKKVDSAFALWHKRYGLRDAVITSMTSRSSAVMKKGDHLSFTHVVQIARADEPSADVHLIDQALHVRMGEQSFKQEVQAPPAALYRLSRPVDNENFGGAILRLRFKADAMLGVCAELGSKGFAAATDTHQLIIQKQDMDRVTLCIGQPIHALHYIKEHDLLVIGYGRAGLMAATGTGEVCWRTTIERIPTLFDSWELPNPQVTAISSTQSDQGTVIAVGCGDNRIRTFDRQGKPLSDWYVYATVPDIIKIADIDGDGHKEVMAAGSYASSSGTFYVHALNGEPKRSISVAGWLCNVRAFHISKVENGYRLACGLNYSENLKFFDIVDGQASLIAKWQLGGTVKSITTDRQGRYIVGTSKGFVMAFDLEHAPLWHQSIRHNIHSLYQKDDQIVVICENGVVLTLSDEGTLHGKDRLPGPPMHTMRMQDGLAMISKEGIYTV